MTYKIDEFSECETLCEGTPENYMVGVTKPSVDKILATDCGFDALALYTFYCYVAKWQGNNSVYAVSDYCMKKLQIGRDRFHKAKQTLIDLELIEDDPRYDHERKRIGKWYVRVRHISGATLRKTYYVENQQGRKTDNINQRLVANIPENNKDKPEETSAMASDSYSDVTNSKLEFKTEKTSENTQLFSYAQNSPAKKTRQPKLADDAFIAKLKEANPRVDFDTELRKMDNWLISRPTRKKTRAFVTNWINRVVDKLPEKEERFNDF